MTDVRRRHILAALAAAVGSGLLAPRFLFAVTGNILGKQTPIEDKNSKENNKTIVKLKEAVEQNYRDFRAWSLLGQAYIQAGDTDQALLAYGQALRINPNDARTRMMVEILALRSNGKTSNNAPKISTLQKQAAAERQAAKARFESSKTGTNARRYRLVIDPGHGGRDNGFIGKKGLREKNVCLDIAVRLAHALSSADVDIFLTRTADFHLTFFQRSLLASLYQADLFLSLHASSVKNADAHGIWVYSHARSGQSEMDRQVATQENKAVRYDLGKKMAKSASLSDIEYFLQSPLTCIGWSNRNGNTTTQGNIYSAITDKNTS